MKEMMSIHQLTPRFCALRNQCKKNEKDDVLRTGFAKENKSNSINKKRTQLCTSYQVPRHVSQMS